MTSHIRRTKAEAMFQEAPRENIKAEKKDASLGIKKEGQNLRRKEH